MLLCLTAFAGPNKSTTSKTSVREYIKKWSPVAQSNMTKYRIPASITLAQGILESGYGNSRMARMANNHFGIKCLGWKGEGYYQQNSQRSCYRKYRDTEECFQDHARIISSKQRYSFLFDFDITDYRSWAKGLKRAGYASNSEYDRLLIKTIEEYKLYEVDRAIAKPSKHHKRVIADAPRVKAVVEPAKPVELELVVEESALETIDRLTKDVLIQVDESGEVLEEQNVVAVPIPDDFEVREPELVMVNTEVKHIITVAGDTYSAIAAANGLTLAQVLEFNDEDQDGELAANAVVYLAEKSKSANTDMCTLRPGQQLWDVSQRYGVKLRSLEKMNGVKHGQALVSGTVIRLR